MENAIKAVFLWRSEQNRRFCSFFVCLFSLSLSQTYSCHIKIPILPPPPSSPAGPSPSTVKYWLSDNGPLVECIYYASVVDNPPKWASKRWLVDVFSNFLSFPAPPPRPDHLCSSRPACLSHKQHWTCCTRSVNDEDKMVAIRLSCSHLMVSCEKSVYYLGRKLQEHEDWRHEMFEGFQLVHRAVVLSVLQEHQWALN